MRLGFLTTAVLLLATLALAQDASAKKPAAPPDDTQESSSRDTRIDTAAPKDDAKNHPNSAEAVSDLDAPPPSDANSSSSPDVQEFHPWNPYKANKDIQVGDFYFKRRNYKGALERHKEALYYKQNDAVATFRVGEAPRENGQKRRSKKILREYLKILPDGPLAKEAHTATREARKTPVIQPRKASRPVTPPAYAFSLGAAMPRNTSTARIQAHQILVGKASYSSADLGFRNRRNLIHHQPADSAKSVSFARFPPPTGTKERRLGRS